MREDLDGTLFTSALGQSCQEPKASFAPVHVHLHQIHPHHEKHEEGRTKTELLRVFIGGTSSAARPLQNNNTRHELAAVASFKTSLVPSRLVYTSNEKGARERTAAPT